MVPRSTYTLYYSKLVLGNSLVQLMRVLLASSKTRVARNNTLVDATGILFNASRIYMVPTSSECPNHCID